MCGRYGFYDPETLSAIFAELDPALWDTFEPTWNAAPSQHLPVILEEDGKLTVRAMQWGLLPGWAKEGMRAQINARSETAAEKPMFRNAMKRRRCIVPANGFYEWQKVPGKPPWFIHPTEREVMLMAGIFEEAEGADGATKETFAILTTAANERMETLHDRMPVMLEPTDTELWLDRELTETEPLQHLLQPADNDSIDAYRVGRDINKPTNDNPDLIIDIEPDVDPEED